MKRFKGFTLSELMIAIAVLGVLCATVLPAMVNNNPNQNKMMIKKAYHTFSEIISELINDDTYYPEADGYSGFDYLTCPDDNNDACKGSTGSKLPFLFSCYLNLKDGKISSADELNTKSSKSDCNGIASSCYYFVTTDGMIWTFPKTDFAQTADADNSIIVGVDVNGDKKPNCYQGSTSCSSRTKNFDQFRMNLYVDGKIEIYSDDIWAMEAIQVDSSLTEDD